jgi:hypothetical protein
MGSIRKPSRAVLKASAGYGIPVGQILNLAATSSKLHDITLTLAKQPTGPDLRVREPIGGLVGAANACCRRRRGAGCGRSGLYGCGNHGGVLCQRLTARRLSREGTPDAQNR